MASKSYRIVPGGGAHFTIVDEDGMSIADGHDIRNEREAIRTLEAMAKESGQVARPVRDASGKLLKVEFAPRASFEISLRISPELDAEINAMSEQLGVSTSLTLLRALGLLKIALNAKAEGKSIGIIDEYGELDQEIEL